MGLPIERSLQPRTEIDAILVKSVHNDLLVQLDESSKPFWIPKSGVKVAAKKVEPAANGIYVTLKLTESKAVAYGLV